MCESRAVPSGKVYRQLFDAQVQLSRSLLAGRRETRTESLSAEDSDAPCSSTSRWLYPVSSRGQQLDEEADDVSRLPDIVVAAQHNSDIIGRLTEKKRKEHEDALKNFNSELTRISEMCATLVRSFSREMLSSLQEVDLRLKDLKDRMDHVNGVSLQGVFSFWEEAEKELKLKKMRVMELHHVLSKFEADRTNKIRDVFRKYCHLLNKISFLPPSDVCRLIHSEASLVNQSLLANRRNVAFLQLRLREENLQQTSLYRLHWDHCLGRWRRNRIGEVVERFRCLCSSEADQQLVSVQQTIQQMKETQRVLEERRCDIISQISSLAPPYCSNALVSDWFNQLTTTNQQIESLHADFLHQLRCCCEQKWQERLAEVEHSKEELLALQLTEEEVDDAISTQLLPLIGQCQSRDEERLADLDLLCDTVARRSLTLSSSAFAVMRGAVLLWETHLVGLEKRKEELERHLGELRASQRQRMQWRKLRLDNLLAGLRQESSEDALKTSLDKTVSYMEDIKLSCSKCVPDQCQLFDRLPSLCVEEFLSYSRSLSSFYHLDRVYTPSQERLQELHPPLIEHQEPEPGEETRRHAPSRHDWLTEAESSLLELYDISNNVTFTSSSGVVYTGPAFRYPDPGLLSSLQQEGHLSQFPEVLLIDTLSRMRTLFMDHLEQHLSDSVNSAITIVTNRKETLHLKEELQLKQLDRKYIQRYICQPRLAELQRHRRRVNIHCEEVMGVLDSCKVDMQKLETSISRMNKEFLAVMSNMEREAAAATRSHQLGSLGAALQGHLDQHIKHTQRCETTFRQAVQAKVEEIRRKTTQLLSSFRLFSEGGDFAPQELKLFQRRLTEEAKQIVVKEEAFYSDMEEFESSSLQQVREVSTRLEENICLMKSEMEFKEQSQQVYGSTQVHLKAEVVGSSQQQSDINNRLEDLKKMMNDAQVSAYLSVQACPDRVLSHLSSANGELKKRRQYLELPPRAQKAVVETESRGRTTAGKSPKRVKQRASKPVRTLRRHIKFIRSDKSFQVFGPEPGPEQSTHTFSSRVTSVLWKANDKLLMDGEEFYRAKKSSVSKLLLLPETLELWAASMQQRLLGYQKETETFLSACREVLEKQLATWDELLQVIPSVLIGNLEHRHEAELSKEVGGVKVELEEALLASEKEKCDITSRLRVSLRNDLLQNLVNREELRQQQLHSAICSAHMQIQEYVRVIGDEFVTSLASITERLLHQLDTSLTSTETKAIATDQPSDNSTVTTEAEEEQNASTTSRTWPGISYYPPPTNIPVDLLPIVTTRRTASITTTKCTMGHLTVIELRDTAVQRFEQLLRTELSQSEDDKHERLKELQRWNTHWRQQIHPLKNTL